MASRGHRHYNELMRGFAKQIFRLVESKNTVMIIIENVTCREARKNILNVLMSITTPSLVGMIVNGDWNSAIRVDTDYWQIVETIVMYSIYDLSVPYAIEPNFKRIVYKTTTQIEAYEWRGNYIRS